MDTSLKAQRLILPRGRLSARVPLNVQERIQQAAEMAGATLNQFVVQAALEAAERVLLKEKQLVLSSDEARRFCQMLDNPPAPNAALRRAQQRYTERKIGDGDSDSAFELKPRLKSKPDGYAVRAVHPRPEGRGFTRN